MVTRRPVFVFLLALGAALLPPARGAAAQGTSGMMPEPITGLDLARYADRLRLSHEQRAAVESVHDAYKQRFRALREGDIARFLEKWGDMQRGGIMPRREVIDALLEDMDRLQDRIRLLDESFFSELEPLLEDDKRVAIASLRLARTRQRYRSDMFMRMGQAPDVDLSEILWQLDLPAEVKAQGEPLVAQYERQLTKRMQDLHEASGGMMRAMLGVYQDAGLEGLTEEQMKADPQIMAKLMEQMQQRMAELGQEMAKTSGEIAELNRKTARQVTALLPEPAGDQFRLRYLGKAYPELGGLLALGQEPWVRSAEHADHLAPAEKAEVAAIIEVYRQRAQHLVDETTRLIDDQRSSSSRFSFNQEAFQAYYQELSQRQAKGQELAAQTQRALEAIVGQDWLAADADAQKAQPVPGEAGQIAGAQMEASKAAGLAGEASEAGKDGDDTAAVAGSTDEWVPPPISPRDVALYSKRLGLDESRSGSARQLRADYAAEIAQLDVLAELTRANQGRWQIDPDTGQPRMHGEQAIDRLYSLRKQAFEAIRARDRAFFEHLQALVPQERQPDVERLHRGRQRQSYKVMAGMRMFDMGGSQEEGVDLMELSQGDALADEQRRQIDPILAEYEASVIPALRARYEARMGWQQAMERLTAMMQAAAGDQAAQMAMAFRYQESMAAAAGPVKEAGSQLVALNRRTLEAILGALPESLRRGFRRAYNRQAFPTVYTDPISVEEHLGRALALEDLSTDQLAVLSSLAGAYWIDYEALCQKMIALTDDDMALMFTDAQAGADYMQRRDDLQKLRFERDELSYRAISRLEGVLSASQLGRVGKLPKPAQSEADSLGPGRMPGPR